MISEYDKQVAKAVESPNSRAGITYALLALAAAVQELKEKQA